MQFFEFNDFEYYALIAADSEEEAVKYYEETVSGIEEDDGFPDEITEDEARIKFNNACKEEEIKEFEELINSLEPTLILIDGSLI